MLEKQGKAAREHYEASVEENKAKKRNEAGTEATARADGTPAGDLANFIGEGSGTYNGDKLLWVGSVDYEIHSAILGIGRFRGVVTSVDKYGNIREGLIGGYLHGVGFQIGIASGNVKAIFAANSIEEMKGSNGTLHMLSIGFGKGPFDVVSFGIQPTAYNGSNNDANFGFLNPEGGLLGFSTSTAAGNPKGYLDMSGDALDFGINFAGYGFEVTEFGFLPTTDDILDNERAFK